MKKVCALLAVGILAATCSPKIKTTVLKKDMEAFNASDPLVVIGLGQPKPADGVMIGRVRAGDTGFSVGCSYDEVIQLIKIKAQSIGANVIKISDRKQPDMWSTCERISAELYRIENVREYELEIVWSSSRPLAWEDFKKTQNHYLTARTLDAAAVSSCGILVQPIRKGLFSSAIIVHAIFYSDNSWVRSDAKNPEVLRHEQAHFDIAEIYARKMRKAFKEAGKDARLITSVVHSKYYQEFSQRQDQYDEETQHGVDKKTQQEWLTVIQNELDELKEFQFGLTEDVAAR